jgi:gamma-glutamyltranspeptidase
LYSAGGCISREDLASYSAKVREGVYVDLGNGLYGCAPPPPSSGAIVLSILNTISGRCCWAGFG